MPHTLHQIRQKRHSQYAAVPVGRIHHLCLFRPVTRACHAASICLQKRISTTPQLDTSIRLRAHLELGDDCNIRPGPDIPEKLERLRRCCEEEGREFAAIEKTCPFAFDFGEGGDKVGELRGHLRWLAGKGIQTVIGFVPHVERLTPLQILGREVIPAVADL